MNTITVAYFNRRADAAPLQQRLAGEGIQAEVHNDLGLERFWFVSKPIGGARLEVPAGEFERAYGLLLKWDDAEDALRNAICCPECRSLRVQFPQFTRRSVIPNMVMGALATIGAVQKEFYCEDCHYTWPREGAKRSRRNPHAAPYYFIEGIQQPDAPHRHA